MNGKRLTLKDFLIRSKKTHGNVYDYSKTDYRGSHEKVIIICPKHGDFLIKAYSHLAGHGCFKCSVEKNASSTRKTTECFIEEAKKTHGLVYDYSKTIYESRHKKIIIICKIHGDFTQIAGDHLRGMGCLKCGQKSCADFCRDTTEDFVRKAKVIHKDKYDYSKSIYAASSKKVEIVCKRHGSFFQRPSAHIHLKQGCPICDESKGERKIFEFLTNKGVFFDKQKTFNDCKSIAGRRLKFDFFIPSKNLLIEYDGEQHFKKVCIGGNHFMSNDDLKDIKSRDKIKTVYAKIKGIRLLRIKYTKLNKIEEILSNKLL